MSTRHQGTRKFVADFSLSFCAVNTAGNTSCWGLFVTNRSSTMNGQISNEAELVFVVSSNRYQDFSILLCVIGQDLSGSYWMIIQLVDLKGHVDQQIA